MRLRENSSGKIKCSLGDLPEAIRELLSAYSANIVELSSEAVKEVTKEGAKVAKKAGSYENRRPKYRDSISTRFEMDTFGTQGQIYAAEHEYSLTHLLEHGHLLWQSPLRDGTRKFPHWKIADDFVHEELPKRIIQKIEND